MSENTETPLRGARKHKSTTRGYAACTVCRARKVRCILGDKPPCEKCRREHRECIFQNTRNAGKHREAPRWENLPNTTLGSQRPLEPELVGTPEPISTSTPRATPRGPLERNGNTHQDGSGNHQSLTNLVMCSILTRPSDALDVLFDAARPGQSFPSQNTSLSSPVTASGQVAVSGLSQPTDEVLDLWDKCRFIRQGWFTAQEAVTYLDLFYKYLAPLSPIVSHDFQDHCNHERLITEEPLLCCTLLVISSRFFILPGPGGVSRSHFIHHRLWQHCELLIRRIMFGQEKHSTAKTRIVGSIEGLMLISDWHPRSVHFPPETDGWDGELISPAYDRRNRRQVDNETPLIRWKEDVFEPARRSERMSWMLLGAAVNLAYELGIFVDSPGLSGPGSTSPHNAKDTLRILQARKLLYIYVTQMASRMGCSSLLPDNISFTTPESLGQALQSGQESWALYMELWVELTGLTKTASAMFFQSGTYIKQQIASGNYLILLQHFIPSLGAWYDQYTTKSSGLPEALKSILLIEFHYLKAYICALSIQAVVERALSRRVGRYSDLSGEGMASCLLPRDQEHIRYVVADSCSVLELAVKMHTEGRLRYAPLRTLICITSSSIFLLKAISLVDRNDDILNSLEILDRCIAALRASGIDDMDFSFRYATLIEKHVALFRARFSPTRIPDIGNSHGDAGVDPSLISTSIPNNGETLDEEIIHDFDVSDWWSRPFDPNIAPFSCNDDGISLAFGQGSLDFLWNMQNMGGE